MPCLRNSSASPRPRSRSPLPIVGPSSSVETFYRCLANGTRGKTKRVESKILQSFSEFARWYARSKNPFIVFENAWVVGLHNWVGEQGETLEIEMPNFGESDSQLYQSAFDMMVASIPNIGRILAEPVVNAGLPTQLGKMMDESRGSACAIDATHIKSSILTYVALILPDRRLEPPLSHAESKELSRGWRHPQLAALLIPAKYLREYGCNPEQVTAEIDSGSRVISGRDFPAFLYPQDIRYNEKQPQVGLFRGLLWLHTFKALFTGPSSAGSAEFRGALTRSCQATRNGLRRVTPETIAYAALHTYFGMSNAKEWRTDMGTFDKKIFFEAMVSILQRENRWQRSLFKWANTKIFGNPDGATDAPQVVDQGPTDVDIFLQQIDDDAGSEGEDEGAVSSGNESAIGSIASQQGHESSVENRGSNRGESGVRGAEEPGRDGNEGEISGNSGGGDGLRDAE
ncbi:hypothetical protein Agabi119p4_1418 [Agaricus bisporus var. burnettii]|nr:hypothetical protein Agabi119p4_1418 [Agaricus bisporus var. burnettii]